MRYNRYLTSSEIRSIARDNLRGRWKDVILLHIVPILTSIIILGGIFLFSILTFSEGTFERANDSFVVNFTLSFITVGISYTLLDIVRKKDYVISPFRDAFQVFSRKYFLPVLLIQLLESIFLFLWSLLFIIPGIVKGYAYSQSYYIYKDSVEGYPKSRLTALDCITESREMMDGHKGRLFELHLSFIGWIVVELVTLGIASIYVRPYMATAEAVFYDNLREVSEGMPYYYDQTSDDEEGFTDF